MKTKLFRAVPAYAITFLFLVVIPVFISLITGFDAPWLKAVFSWKAFLLLSMLTLGVLVFQVRRVRLAHVCRVLAKVGEKTILFGEWMKQKIFPPPPPIEVPYATYCAVYFQEDGTWKSYLSRELCEDEPLVVYEDHTNTVYAQLEDDACHLFLGDRHIRTLYVGDVFRLSNTEYIKFI